MARMYQKLVLAMARDFANSEFRKQLEEVLGLLEAVPGQGGGVHSGLWGEEDSEAQWPELPSLAKVVVGGIMDMHIDSDWGVQTSMLFQSAYL